MASSSRTSWREYDCPSIRARIPSGACPVADALENRIEAGATGIERAAVGEMLRKLLVEPASRFELLRQLVKRASRVGRDSAQSLEHACDVFVRSRFFHVVANEPRAQRIEQCEIRRHG